MIHRAALLEPFPPYPTTIRHTHAVHPPRPVPYEVSISTPVSCTSSRSQPRQVHSLVIVAEEQESGWGLRLRADFFPTLHETLPPQLPITVACQARPEQVPSPSTCT